MTGVIYGGDLEEGIVMTGVIYSGDLEEGGVVTGVIHSGDLEEGGVVIGVLYSGDLEEGGVIYSGDLEEVGVVTGVIYSGDLEESGVVIGVLYSGDFEEGGVVTGVIHIGDLEEGGVVTRVIYSGDLEEGVIYSGDLEESGVVIGVIYSGDLEEGGVVIGVLYSGDLEEGGVVIGVLYSGDLEEGVVVIGVLYSGDLKEDGALTVAKSPRSQLGLKVVCCVDGLQRNDKDKELSILKIIYPHFHGRRVRNNLGKSTFSRPNQDSNPDVPVFSNPVQHENAALEHSASETVANALLLTSILVTTSLAQYLEGWINSQRLPSLPRSSLEFEIEPVACKKREIKRNVDVCNKLEIASLGLLFGNTLPGEEHSLLSKIPKKDEVYPHLRKGRLETHFVKIALNSSNRDSNLDLPVITSLVYCESSALDPAVTEVGQGFIEGFLDLIDVPSNFVNDKICFNSTV
uniref:Uncharacterized protein n=1 Tax=Timema tahoe TaxID=61484 RepID=A0A7R9NVT5_9NEOP|nr:unnamed protein product [Timema tahoe]